MTPKLLGLSWREPLVDLVQHILARVLELRAATVQVLERFGDGAELDEQRVFARGEGATLLDAARDRRVDATRAGY